MTWSSEPSAGSSWSSRPRVPGPLLGWRAWRVLALPSGLCLASAVFDESWPVRGALTAACRLGHAAPDPACTCGVYAVREPRGAVRYLVGRDDSDVVHRVLGRVALWGVTVEGEHGWRAERAQPVRLLVPAGRTSGLTVDAPAVARALGRAYGIPAQPLAVAEPEPLVRALAA